jgi:hypothetical protein
MTERENTVVAILRRQTLLVDRLKQFLFCSEHLFFWQTVSKMLNEYLRSMLESCFQTASM